MAKAVDLFMEELIKQIGYKETGNNITKYGKFFDTPKADGGAWRYFNTHKQGSEWCSLEQHYCLYKKFGDKDTRKMLNEPSPSKNCGAGVKYLWGYMTKAKRTFKRGEKKPQRGDLIFINTKKAKPGHIGAVEEVIGNKVHTIEGNKSNMCKRCEYSLTDTAIYGYGRPDWSVWDDKQPVPPPTPEPGKKVVKASQTAESFDKYYARSWTVKDDVKVLNIRDGAGTSYKSLTKMPAGAKCRCYGYFTKNWLYVRYETDTTIYEGFASKNHLK